MAEADSAAGGARCWSSDSGFKALVVVRVCLASRSKQRGDHCAKESWPRVVSRSVEYEHGAPRCLSLTFKVARDSLGYSTRPQLKPVRSLLLVVVVASLGSCTGTSDADASFPGAASGGTNNAGTSGMASGGTGNAGASAAASGGTSNGGTSGMASGGTSNGGIPSGGASNGGMSGGGAGGTMSGGGAPSGGASNAGMGGGGVGGSTAGGVGGGAGGATAGSGGTGGTPAGGTGALSCGSGKAVQLATSIPQEFRQPAANAGMMVRRTYPCYYYTDATSAPSGDPSRFVLQRRSTPVMKEANVYVPYDYSTSGSYPVIYILHGITDNENTWLERGSPRPNVLFDNLIARGETPPFIAVFPNGVSSASFRNTGFDNSAGYYFFANELVNDLIPFMESQYSVAGDRNCRALSGFSMGGMQTINTGLCQSLQHVAKFGALSAAPTTYNSTQVAEYVGRQNPGTYPIGYFYNMVGSSDGTARTSHEAAVNNLTSRSQYVTDQNFVYHNAPGGHDYTVASIGLYNFLRISFGR
jgi:enterochelin esterase-like enzyme